jgi:hypothetical protein
MHRIKLLRTLHLHSIVLLSCLLLNMWDLTGQSDRGRGRKWVGTWSTGMQLVETRNNPPLPGLTGNSLRQVVRVSIGGEALRVKFSNEFSKSRLPCIRPIAASAEEPH